LDKSLAMNRQVIIERTIKAINLLPEDKAREISDFADFITKRYEEQVLTEGIARLISNSKSFDFLKDEQDLYTEADIKEPYNG
jgi:bisphosphoglycerate-independent phosphoglycerate mutase (AlkP superfamily)